MVALSRRHILRILPYGCLTLAVLFVGISINAVHAEGATAISQSFLTSETNIAPGALMSLKTGSSNTVELANTQRVSRLNGVVGNNSLVQLGNSGNIQIVTSGVTLALVSDANGSINAGDRITASPIDGIGMKAVANTQVVGTAQVSLSSAVTQTRVVTSEDGSLVNVHIGLIPVQVNVTFYVAQNSQVSFLPPFLQDFANSVSGREVSPVRVIIATLILLLAFLSIAVLLYSTVRSSIISIGRNPLSERAVRKGIIQIGLTVIGILLLTLITIYLILTT